MRARHLIAILLLLGILAVGGVAFVAFRQGPPVQEGVLSPSLSPLTLLSDKSVNRIVVRSGDEEVAIVKGEARWTVGTHAAYAAKLDALWKLLGRIDLLPTVSANPKNHDSLGVAPEQALTMSFWQGEKMLDQLLIGHWSPGAGVTFIRRPESDSVSAVPLDLRGAFAPTIEAWRDRVIVDASSVIVQSLRFLYPDEQFSLQLVVSQEPSQQPGSQQGQVPLTSSGAESLTRPGAAGSGAPGGPAPTPAPQARWVLHTADSAEVDASPDRVAILLFQLAPFLATGFADDQRQALEAVPPEWSLELGWTAAGTFARLDFHPKDEQTYYVRRAGRPDVYVVSADAVAGLMARAKDLLPQEEEF